MNTLANRLKSTMKERGITQQKLGDLVGVSQRSISKIIDGQTLNPKYIVEIADALNVSVNWLKTGEGMSEGNAESDTTILNLYDVAASCGHGHINPDYPELLRSIEMPKAALNELLGTDNLKGVALMPPDGDSMEPTIPAKSMTLIKTDVSAFESSGVYLITFQGFTYIKRLSRGKGGRIHVMSDNPVYSKTDFEILPSEFDELIIHGKFWKVLPLDFKDI